MPTQNELELQNAELRRSVALSELAVQLASKGMSPSDATYFSRMVASRVTPNAGGVKVKGRQGEEITLEALADEVSALARDLAVNEPKTLVPGDSAADGADGEEVRYQGHGPKKRKLPPLRRISAEAIAAEEVAAAKKAKIEAVAVKNIQAGRYRGVAGL